jgi:peptide deformylase
MDDPIINGSSSIQSMLDTLAVSSDGVALAANQIGWDRRVFVISLGSIPSSPLAQIGPRPEVIINPRVTPIGNERTFEAEGCLSFPGITLAISRPKHVNAFFESIDGTPHELVLSDFWARVFCHEIDHLEGKLFLDHLSPRRGAVIREHIMSRGFPRR